MEISVKSQNGQHSNSNNIYGYTVDYICLFGKITSRDYTFKDLEFDFGIKDLLEYRLKFYVFNSFGQYTSL